VSLSADLMKADEDPRPVAAQLLDRAIAQLPPGVSRSSTIYPGREPLRC